MSYSKREKVRHTNDATMKGQLIADLAGNYQGVNDEALLNLTGVAVEGEVFNLGASKFEYRVVATAETATGSAAAATTPNITLNVAPDRNFVVGEVFEIDQEYCQVTSYVDASLIVAVTRGYGGSTAAIQSADIILRSVSGSIPITGNLIIPLDATDQTETASQTILAVPALSSYGAQATGTDDVLFDAPFSDAHPANSEGLTNGTLAAFAGGIDSISVESTTHLFKAVTSTAFSFVAPKTPVAVSALLLDDSTGGVAITTLAAFVGRTVTITEGTPVWEDGVDNVLVTVYY